VTPLDENRIVKAFGRLKAAGARTLVPFITAGHPDLGATEALLKQFELMGVNICELGIPFSDPIADGPTIQASYTEALDAGVTCRKIFETVERYRASGGGLALVAMVSYSIVYRHGVEGYLAELAETGFDGIIVPDLSLEEAETFESQAAGKGLANIMLIAPTTPGTRRLEIARHSRGFIYFISVAGITGERDELPAETFAAVAELREQTDTPVCVGFGISNPQQVAAVCKAADGAIVGSAIVHRINDARDLPAEKLAERIARFVGELMAPLEQQA